MEEEMLDVDDYANWLKWVSDAKEEDSPCLSLQIVKRFHCCCKFTKQKVVMSTTIPATS
jgi:hypothetical protein